MGRKLEVDLVANARPFNNTLDAAANKVTGFSGRLKAMGGGSLGKGLAIGAGVAGFNLLTTAVSTAVGAMDEMHQAFLADQESQLRLQNILQNTVKNYDEAVKSAEDFAGAQQRLGFEDDSVRDSLGQLVGITHDLAKAQELSTIAIDLARAKNISLAQATDTVARAYTGVARGLTLVGIDARGATTGLELVNRIAQNTKGAAETYAKSGAGRMAAANAKLQDTMEKVGGAIDQVSQVVIPVMVAGLGGLVDGAGEFIKGFTDVANFVTTNLNNAFLFFAQVIQNVRAQLAGLIDLAQTLINGVLPGLARGFASVGGNGSGGFGDPGNGGVVFNPNAKLDPSQIQDRRGQITLPKSGSVNIGAFNPFPFHDGGIVGGPYGSDQLIMAQAGERVIPNGGASGQTIIVNIASFIGSDRDIDRFSDRLAFRLRSTALS